MEATIILYGVWVVCRGITFACILNKAHVSSCPGIFSVYLEWYFFPLAGTLSLRVSFACGCLRATSIYSSSMNKFAHRTSRSVVLIVSPTLCVHKNAPCCLSDLLLRTAQSLTTKGMKETGSMTIDTVRGPTPTHQARCTTVDGKKGGCTEQDATPVNAHGMNERYCSRVRTHSWRDIGC